MKKTVLSALSAFTLMGVASEASDVQLYQDANGQVWTQPAKDRVAIKNSSNETALFSKASKIKFSVDAFGGYTAHDYKSDTAGKTYKKDSQKFELRRGYFQVKAYMMDDPKSYYRITMDLKRDDDVDNGSYVVRAKYAYVNLHDLLPMTSLEAGLAHRPWHDYEEHNSWLYRSISEVLIEDHNGAHLSNSADLGAMLKTRTKYLDVDVGVFNGEGYHEDQNDGNGLSLEWRFTGHLLGTSSHHHPEKNRYLDASFFGQLNYKHNESVANSGVYDDLKFYGFHAVYNMPSFLLSAQYVTSQDTAKNSTYVSKGSGDGYSLNTEVRLGSKKNYKLLGRYDNWTPKAISGAVEYAQRTYIVGGAYKQNSNLEWVANATITDNEEAPANSMSSREKYNGIAYMLTAELKF